jgi:galactokinase
MRREAMAPSVRWEGSAGFGLKGGDAGSRAVGGGFGGICVRNQKLARMQEISRLQKHFWGKSSNHSFFLKAQ